MNGTKHDTGKGPKNDARGQFTNTQHGGGNDGVASASPRVLSDKDDGDATFPVKKGTSGE